MSKHKYFRSGEQAAKLRSVLIGVGGAFLVTLAVAVFNPKIMRRPPPPPVPTLVQGKVAPVPSGPSAPRVQPDQAAPAPQREAVTAPESPPAAPGSQAFVSPSEPNAVADAAQAPPSGEAAELPLPAPQAHPVHPRPVTKRLTHRALPARAARPAGAGPAWPAAAVQPPPPVVQEPGVLVGGRRPPQDVPSRRVSLADLNLATDVGACKALSRIRRAAEEVCPYEGERSLSFVRERWTCMQESVNRAVQDMHVRRVQDLLDKGHGGC